MRNHFSILLAYTLLLASCEPKFDEPSPSAGNADFSTYVAVGSSYSSGFADGALSKYGQKASFPALLAQQMQLAGGGTFNIPLLVGEKGTYPDYDISKPNPYTYTLPRFALVNEPDCKGEIGLAPERIDTIGDNEINFRDNSQRIANGSTVFHHYGIPAMKSVHVVTPYYAAVSNYTRDLAFSPFYWRFASDTSTAVLLDVLAAQPTFFTIELGMSDVLAYALDGGVGRAGDRDQDYTTVSRFRGAIDQILDSLTAAHGAHGVIANVPDVTVFPYFTVIEYDALELDAAEAAAMNTQWSSVTGHTFHEGENNPFVIKEDNAVRIIKPTEHVLLGIPIDSLKCLGLGRTEPIGDEYILSESEIANVQSFVDQYNTVLQEMADEHGVPVVDLADFMDEIYNEKTIEGIDYTAEFVSGGFFSLDGLHPSDRGQALIANEFIKVINQHYNAQIPLLVISDYPGVLVP